jgi:hypothetical protein
MIIISLTTIPPRFDNLYITIDSILAQTILPDKILINIPEKYHNYSYDTCELPKFSSEIVIINNTIIDYGPATKLLGLYNHELYNKMIDDDIIIVIDDDRIYNKDLIKNMLDYHKLYPDKALTVAGWDIGTISRDKYVLNNTKQPRGIEYVSCGYINLLGGCCGFLLNKKMCPFNFKELFDLDPKDSKYYVDDIWISGFITLNNIDIYLILNSILMSESSHINDSISCLCDNTRTEKDIKCIEYFRDKYNIWKD